MKSTILDYQDHTESTLDEDEDDIPWHITEVINSIKYLEFIRLGLQCSMIHLSVLRVKSDDLILNDIFLMFHSPWLSIVLQNVHRRGAPP